LGASSIVCATTATATLPYAQLMVEVGGALWEEADRYALEWARELIDPKDARRWLERGASPGDARGVAGLSRLGVPPEAGMLPLHDDRQLHPGGLPLVRRVCTGNISALNARALLLLAGRLRPDT
jgi:hypothetical protein